MTPTEPNPLQPRWTTIHPRLADLAACRVLPPHVDRYKPERRLLGQLDAIEYRVGTDAGER